MQQMERRKFLGNFLKAGSLLPFVGGAALLQPATAAAGSGHSDPTLERFEPIPYPATDIPDRIILTVTDKPATSVTLNWRTANAAGEHYAEYAIADAHPDFAAKAKRVAADARSFRFEQISAAHHRVTLQDLQPATAYTYRVGNDKGWSEWMPFRTAAAGNSKLSFIYLGDAQVGIRPFWSRVIRKAYAQLPDAQLIIHAGDLVNRANKDEEWGQWFEAGGYIHGSIPAIVTPGNHEYTHEDDKPHLSVYWKEQFGLPANGTGDDSLEGSVYYTDIQNVRFISLNTMMLEEAANEAQILKQTAWLEKLLKNNPCKWTCVTMHHPVFSTKKGRDNKEVKTYFKPLFDQYKVDIVLQGHDHAYGRGMHKVAPGGTMYLVTVSGSKMYEYDKSIEWTDVVTGDIQLYSLVTIDNNTLSFRSCLATGEVFDAFDLVKQPGRQNRLIERKPL